MFAKVLVPTDLSPASDRVMGCLCGLRTVGAQQAVLLHALGIRHLDAMKYELARLVEPRLQEQKAELEKQGFLAQVCVAPGPPALEIPRIAAEEQADLIAIGTHGASLAGEVLLGNVAMHVIHHATVPILVIRIRITEGSGGVRCEAACGDWARSILHPTDFSATAERAFGYLEQIVAARASRVTLLHVQDRARLSPHLEHRLEEFNRIDRERLERLRSRLLDRGASAVAIEIPYGSPIQDIVRRAQREDYSLIIMGSQGRGFIAEVFLGSVSHNVMRQAPIPVLLVPAAR